MSDSKDDVARKCWKMLDFVREHWLESYKNWIGMSLERKSLRLENLRDNQRIMFEKCSGMSKEWMRRIPRDRRLYRNIFKRGNFESWLVKFRLVEQILTISDRTLFSFSDWSKFRIFFGEGKGWSESIVWENIIINFMILKFRENVHAEDTLRKRTCSVGTKPLNTTLEHRVSILYF